MSSETANVNPYLRTKILTASPEELRLMLLDGAVRFARQGRDALGTKNYEAVYNGFQRCRDILVELITSTRPEVDPDLCAKVSSLYTYMYTELTSASLEKDQTKADHVIQLLEYERETWRMLMDKLAGERGQANVPDRSRPAPPPPAAAEHRPLSVQG
ncbi:MAG: flagellar export chaperone FliS [Phycisphaeraceae bacterium]|nr:flagellar export chaperone FliS [Phycisphaeraceae bacterium]